MSKEQFQKMETALMPFYRTIMIALMGVVTFFVTKTYTVIQEDHDQNIKQEERISNLVNRMDQVEKFVFKPSNPPKYEFLEER